MTATPLGVTVLSLLALGGFFGAPIAAGGTKPASPVVLPTDVAGISFPTAAQAHQVDHLQGLE